MPPASSTAARRSALGLCLVLGLAVGVLGGCQSSGDKVESLLEGRITVRSDIDDSGDYSGFRVMVADASGTSIDTLALTRTGKKGRFRTWVEAPSTGIYPLIIWGRRGQQRLASTELVVAEGDTASIDVTFPQRGPFRVRSPENAALSGYRNTMARHRQTLVKQIRGNPEAGTNDMARSIRQTSSILWRLQDTYPDTYASRLAAVESLSLLEGWNDSLVVERAQSIAPGNPRYVEAVRIGRRAMARWNGQQAALAMLDTFMTEARTPEQKAGVQAIRVRTFIDSLESEAALAAARTLKREYPNSEWADWADRAMYEVNNLLPGKTAPTFAAQSLRGDSVSLQGLKGRPVVLEFYRPGSNAFAGQLATRNAIYQATRGDSVAFVSVSLADSTATRALVEGERVPGRHVVAPEGEDGEIPRQYNVTSVPTRFLIDRDGLIVGRYPESALLGLSEDLTALLRNGDTGGEAPAP